jgi:hypothetical protein
VNTPRRFVYEGFVDAAGHPRLAPCAVLFIDLLGVRAMNASPQVGQHLRDLDRAVGGMYRNFLAADSPWPAAFFSDTLVLTSPVLPAGEEESAIGSLIVQAAWLQLNLIQAGFFARGGLSLGDFHIRDGLLFGPALVEAAEIEHAKAVHPRVVLSPSAVASQERDLAFYSDAAQSPQNSLLLRDGDGQVFINYLALLLDEPTDPAPAFEMHRDAVVERLRRHQVDKRIWEKYRWAAEYHNAVCAARLPNRPELLVPHTVATWQFAPFV